MLCARSTSSNYPEKPSILYARIRERQDYNLYARSGADLKKNGTFVVVGLALYVGAFFLVAAHDADSSSSFSGRGYPGWFCAAITLRNVWGHEGLDLLRQSRLVYFSLLFSGWINPLFLITLLAQLVRPKGRLAFVLRILLLLMFPRLHVNEASRSRLAAENQMLRIENKNLAIGIRRLDSKMSGLEGRSAQVIALMEAN